MTIRKIILFSFVCLLAGRAAAQAVQEEKYHKFVVYGGAGPGYFLNNLVTFKDDVHSFQYAFSARVMWEPEHSHVSLGFETGYYRVYSVTTTQPVDAHITNSSVPIMLVVSMKFSGNWYASWSMGQSVSYNKVDAPSVDGNHDATTWSLSDFQATVGYRLIRRSRISYAAELRGYYSSPYRNTVIAAFFVVGYRL